MSALMARLAARKADIVNVNYDLREGRVNATLVRTGMAAATDEKLGWIREAAGRRIGKIELSVTIFFANITEDRESVAHAADKVQTNCRASSPNACL